MHPAEQAELSQREAVKVFVHVARFGPQTTQDLIEAGVVTNPDDAIAAMASLAFISTVIAYILYFRLVSSAGATNAALVTFLIPISAILLGVFILDETFSLQQASGAFLIGLGLIVMDGRMLSRR